MGVLKDFLVPVPAALQSIQNVFIILMENRSWSSIKGSASAPYINNTLLPMASYATQYYTPPGNHPSLPNYLWLEAGTNFGISNDNDPSSNHQSTTNHLVALLNNAGISWTSYQEDISGTVCPLTAVNKYAPKHNPMVYFDDVTSTNNSSSAYCIANVRPYSELATDLANHTVTRYNFITPDLTNDMHDAAAPVNDAIKQGDNWLSHEVPIILNSQAYSNNGALFIVWDEGASPTADGPIGCIVISPLAKGGGYTNTIHYTHSSTLRTMQEIFNVGPLLNDATNATDLIDLFNLATSPAQLSISPSTGLTSAGLTGGSFSPSNQTYTLSNSGGATLSWTASITANWLTLSATAGTLAPSSNTTVTVSINANANSLAVGNYSDTVSFTNTTNGAGNDTRSVSLTVNNTSAQIITNGYSLSTENCSPGNGVVDPGETVTVNLSLKNTGSANTSNLVATLVANSGVTLPSAAQTYGVVSTDGTPVSQPFSFTAGGTCGGSITANLQLVDGVASLGTISYIIPLGITTTSSRRTLTPSLRRRCPPAGQHRPRARNQLGHVHGVGGYCAQRGLLARSQQRGRQRTRHAFDCHQQQRGPADVPAELQSGFEHDQQLAWL